MSEVNSKTIKNYNDKYMIFYDLYDILPNMNMYKHKHFEYKGGTLEFL